MKTSIEIEFKTLIDKDKYEEMIDAFDLRENIFYQTNFYFDTPDFKLRQNGMALRIRHRNNKYKLTLKRPKDNCLYEDSIVIPEEVALDYLQNGFNLKDFGMDYDVALKANQETYRAVTPYKEGKLFFDQCNYANTTDYEIEYEADDYNTGLKLFHEFLNDYQIKKTEIEHKIERVYKKFGL